jgi:hypothetical protein
MGIDHILTRGTASFLVYCSGVLEMVFGSREAECSHGTFLRWLAIEQTHTESGRKDVSMRIPENGKSWLLGLLGGAMLASIHLFLAFTFESRDGLMAVGVPVGTYLIVSAASAWIASFWTHSWDAGLKAGCITGASGGIGALCALLIFLLVRSGGQLSAGRGYAFAALLTFLLPCLLGIGISLWGALLGCKVASVK